VEKTVRQLGVGNIGRCEAAAVGDRAARFANSDFAFQGNHLFQGNFYGVNIYDISNPANTTLLTSLVCPGGQGDVSVYKNLLFMSVEMPNGRLDCGAQGFPPEPPPPAGEEKEKKRRLPRAKGPFPRREDLRHSDIKNPKQVAAVQTCRGSHTHTLVTDPNDKDTFISTSPGHRLCVSRKNCLVLRRSAGQRPEYGAVSYRRDQGSGGGTARR